MILAFNFGDVTIKPSTTESILFALGMASFGYGMWVGRPLLTGTGVALCGGVGYRAYEKAAEMRDPELMNGYFLTGGKLSAMDGKLDAARMRKLLAL